MDLGRRKRAKVNENKRSSLICFLVNEAKTQKVDVVVAIVVVICFCLLGCQLGRGVPKAFVYVERVAPAVFYFVAIINRYVVFVFDVFVWIAIGLAAPI